MFIEEDRPRVREGDVLIITNFSVTENIDTYKLIKYPFKIVLHEETRVESVESFIGSINGFHFVQFDDILDKNITDNQCVGMYYFHVSNISYEFNTKIGPKPIYVLFMVCTHFVFPFISFINLLQVLY